MPGSSKSEKAQVQDLSLGIIINYKANLVENKTEPQTNTAISKSQTNKTKSTNRTLSNAENKSKKPPISNLSGLRFEVEGRNLNQVHTENLDEFTNNLAMGLSLPKPSSDSISLNRTLFPRIEPKGARLANVNNNENKKETNNILNNRNQPVFNNILNVSALLSRPYQLSRVETAKTNVDSNSNHNNRHQSDFYDDYNDYDYEEEVENSDTETIKAEETEPILRSNLSKYSHTSYNSSVYSTGTIETISQKSTNPSNLQLNNLVRNRMRLKKFLN